MCSSDLPFVERLRDQRVGIGPRIPAARLWRADQRHVHHPLVDVVVDLVGHIPLQDGVINTHEKLQLEADFSINDPDKILDHDQATFIRLPIKEKDTEAVITLKYKQPFEARIH